MRPRYSILLAIMLSIQAGIASSQSPSGGPDISVRVISESDGIPAGGRGKLALEVTVPEGWHINSDRPREEYLIPTSLDITPPEGFTVGVLVYPAEKEHYLQGTDTPLWTFDGTFPIAFEVAVAADVAPGEYRLPATLTYQACNDTQCWMPMTREVDIPVTVLAAHATPTPVNADYFSGIVFDAKPATQDAEKIPSTPAEPASAGWDPAAWESMANAFTVIGRNSGYMSSTAFLQWLDSVEQGTGSASLNQFAGMSPWLIAVLTLIGGLALNLTPCVLPIIPLNLAIIGAGAKAASRWRGFLLGTMYGAAMAFVYGVLGIAAATLGVAFGTINASPWFNLTVAVIFVIMAIAMFDWINIDFSRFRTAVNVPSRPGGSLITAFVMGAVAALLAGACVGPVVISVILFAQDLYAKGVYIGLGLPFLLGLGMALPWPLAGAGLGLLPKPGAWMVRVKQVLGVLILLLALYYGYEGVQLMRDRYFVDENAVKQEVTQAENWSHNLLVALTKARQEGKPVFVDFWATWCKNCLTMNQTTFKNEEVLKRLDGYVKVKFQAQQLDKSPAKDVMDRWGVGGLGLPVYVVLKPTP